MSKQYTAARLIKAGSPPSIVATELQNADSSTLDYIRRAIGAGILRRVDVVRSISASARDAVEDLLNEMGAGSPWELTRELAVRGQAVPQIDVEAYLSFRDAVFADLYEVLRIVEVQLHGLVKRELINKYGESNWWREGIPERIRSDCAAALEKDPEPAPDRYCYTTLIDLANVFEANWSDLSPILPTEYRSNRQKFRSLMNRLNRTRNSVMHPIRATKWSEEDFALVECFAADLVGRK